MTVLLSVLLIHRLIWRNEFSTCTDYILLRIQHTFQICKANEKVCTLPILILVKNISYSFTWILHKMIKTNINVIETNGAPWYDVYTIWIYYMYIHTWRFWTQYSSQKDTFITIYMSHVSNWRHLIKGQGMFVELFFSLTDPNHNVML